MADPDSRAGQSYATPAILQYVQQLYALEDEALRAALGQIRSEGLPAIQIGPMEGRILQLLLRMADARRVVEIGTLAGYSAIWIARSLPSDGHLWTCEFNPKHAAVARRVLEKAGLAGRATVVEGAALETLPGLERHGPFDTVFVDADKGNYAQYAAWATRNLRRGGLLIGDNAYLFGFLAGRDPGSEVDGRSASAEEIAAMRRFHELLASKYDSVCLPTPDGLAVGALR